MKNLRSSDLKNSLGCKPSQYPTKPLISIVEKKTRRDAKKTGELKVPVKPSRDHTTIVKVRNHSSAISLLHTNLLNISQLLGETRSSRDSAGLFLDSLIQFGSLNKNTKTLTKTTVLSYVFFSSHKLLENAIFPFCLRYSGLVWASCSGQNPRQTRNMKCGCDNSSNKLVFVMKTYYWPPWP